ncbi:MAG: hypothetical protein FWD91_01085 [Treponema sp.]|nr:hypothetical protein [Treponema sp.]
MIFDLPPILGLIPLVVYIILAFNKKIHAFVNVVICVIIGGILTRADLLKLGSIMWNSLGSFLGLVGLIIMLGSGLGLMLKETGIAEFIVYTMMKKIGVNTMNRSILATMLTSMTMVFLLNTLTGGNAVIAPIIIPLVASVGMTSSTLAAVLQAAGVTGLFLSPFSPPMVVMMQITGLPYGQILLYASLPVCIPMWIITYINAKRIQKKTVGIDDYPQGTALEVKEYVATPETKLATLFFSLAIVASMAYGIINKVGVTHAVTVIAVSAVAAGIGARFSVQRIFDTIMKGCGQYVWLFFMFIMFDPFLSFIAKSGAFDAILELTRPLIDATGKFGVTFVSTIISIFSIQGAAVAQALMMDSIFRPVVDHIGLSMHTWALVILISSQMTSFAYPGLDIFAAMGIARTTNIKPMLMNGWSIIIAILVVLAGSIILVG